GHEPAHLGVPAARLVAQMATRFQQKLQRRLPHALPLVGSIRRRPHLRCNPSGGTHHRNRRRVRVIFFLTGTACARPPGPSSSFLPPRAPAPALPVPAASYCAAHPPMTPIARSPPAS